MSEEVLRQQLEEAKKTIEMLQNELVAMDKGLNSLNMELEKRIDERTEKLKQAVEEIRLLNKELENRVEAKTADLTVANKELDAFAYSVSHDLRAPLRAVDGFSQILKEEYGEKLDEEGCRLVSVIQNSTREMGQLIDDLLVFSRLGRKEIKVWNIDMNILVQEILDKLRFNLSNRKIQFNVHTLPSSRGDRSMIHEVLMNLISNAIKFTAPREVAIIEINGETNGNENSYYVRDNGVGFDMKYADKLFRVFQRLHSKEEFEGTGIGLALVQRIINRHGGRVWAESTVNAGATFYFTLPPAEEKKND